MNFVLGICETSLILVLVTAFVKLILMGEDKGIK